MKNFLAPIQKLVKSCLKSERTLILLSILVISVLLIQYSSIKGKIVSYMSNPRQLASNNNSTNNSTNNKSTNSTVPTPAMPAGLNELPSSPNNSQNIISNAPNNLKSNPIDPQALLPKDNNNEWAKLNPSTNTQNLLNAGHHAGIDTKGASLRNANLQIRSDPPCPRNNVSPWLQSTIDPDMTRKALQ